MIRTNPGPARYLLAAAAIVTVLTPQRLAAQAAAPSLDQLAWLSGSWFGRSGDTAMEEHWTTPGGGMLIGMHRDVKGDRTVSFEFIRIEARDGTLHYVASPRGATPTTFALKELGSQRVVFENTAHDFPQRIIYWREGDTLHARVEGTVNGKLEGQEWTWRLAITRPAVP